MRESEPPGDEVMVGPRCCNSTFGSAETGKKGRGGKKKMGNVQEGEEERRRQQTRLSGWRYLAVQLTGSNMGTVLGVDHEGLPFAGFSATFGDLGQSVR